MSSPVYWGVLTLVLGILAIVTTIRQRAPKLPDGLAREAGIGVLTRHPAID